MDLTAVRRTPITRVSTVLLSAVLAALVLLVSAPLVQSVGGPQITGSASAEITEEQKANISRMQSEMADLKAKYDDPNTSREDKVKLKNQMQDLQHEITQEVTKNMLGSGECNRVDMLCKGKKAVTDAAKEGFSSAAKSLWQGAVRMAQLSMSWFIKIPTPHYQDYDVIQEIQRATIGLQLFGLTLSIIVIGFRLALARRQAAMTEAEEGVKSLFKAMFGAWMFGAFLTTLAVASDELSKWILEDKAMKADPSKMLANFGNLEYVGGLGAGLMFVVAVIGILAGLLQLILLVGRQAMLAVVVSLVPVIGSFGGTSTGKMAFSKIMSWTISLLLWKPIAACVYWVAFWLAAGETHDPQRILMGMILLMLSTAVLPILVKLISGGAAMSGGSGGQAAAMTMGAVAAGGAIIATGGAAGAAGAGGGAASTATQAGAAMGGPSGPGGGSQPGGGTGGGPNGDGGSQGSGSGRKGGADSSMVPAAPESEQGSSGGRSGSDGLAGAMNAGSAMSNNIESFFDSDNTEYAGAGDSLR